MNDTVPVNTTYGQLKQVFKYYCADCEHLNTANYFIKRQNNGQQIICHTCCTNIVDGAWYLCCEDCGEASTAICDAKQCILESQGHYVIIRIDNRFHETIVREKSNQQRRIKSMLALMEQKDAEIMRLKNQIQKSDQHQQQSLQPHQHQQQERTATDAIITDNDNNAELTISDDDINVIPTNDDNKRTVNRIRGRGRGRGGGRGRSGHDGDNYAINQNNQRNAKITNDDSGATSMRISDL